MSSPRFIVKEIREQHDNEFIFGVSERVVACKEINRLFMFLREDGYQVYSIDKRSLPDDTNGNSLVGWVIKKENSKEKDNEER